MLAVLVGFVVSTVAGVRYAVMLWRSVFPLKRAQHIVGDGRRLLSHGFRAGNELLEAFVFCLFFGGSTLECFMRVVQLKFLAGSRE